MSGLNANRRKVLIEQQNEIPHFEAGVNIFGRIVKCHAGDLFITEVIDDEQSKPSEQLIITTQIFAKLPPKFKHVIYAKPGDLVMLAPETEEFNTKTSWYIAAILSQQHIIAFIKDQSLPEYFTPEQFAHKAGTAALLNNKTATDRIMTSNYAANSDDDEDFMPTINNRRRNPFLGSGSSSSDDDE